ncbi:unnamed protein product [Heligmosomoides polygyrus]|uniref:Secreted protein n=1 Tax=Heligmosomoides polygyrus TaxID=6339 RepID=A0A183GC23_HELPZ|nr:unnamed protein product [Heligmosomoides polygyrus]
MRFVVSLPPLTMLLSFDIGGYDEKLDSIPTEVQVGPAVRKSTLLEVYPQENASHSSGSTPVPFSFIARLVS